MRSGFLALMVTAGLALTAQDVLAETTQSVRVNADGSFTIIDSPAAKKPKAEKPVLIEPVQAPKEEVAQDPEPQPVPEPAPAPQPKRAASKKPPAEAPKPVVQEEEKFESVFSPEPVEEITPLAKPEPVIEEPVKKIEKKAEKKKTAAKPKVKPERQAKEKPVPAEPIAQAPAEYELPPKEGALTRDDALRIAIQVAPPFKRSTVLPGNYNGIPVFEVILQTEDGDQSILVNAETGEFVNPKKSSKKKK